MLNKIFTTFYFLFFALYFPACQPPSIPESNLSTITSTMKITSQNFESNQSIPPKYTCDGDNINPALNLIDIPADSQSLVLIVDDPDAPSGNWTHWLVWNIDPTTTLIHENSVPINSIQGTTSFGQPGYGGPCPPSGTHRYFFKIYALNTMLDLSSNTNKANLLIAIKDHIIDHAELVGIYERKK